MMRIDLPLKRIHPDNLRAELLAEGVVLLAGFDAIIVRGNRVVLSVADGTDEATVRQVYEAHSPPPDKTPEQVKRERVAASLTATDDTSERLKVVVKVLYQSLVETRAAFNNLIDSLSGMGVPLPPKLRNRTWEESIQSVVSEINKEVQP